jgi:hypothetical protein
MSPETELALGTDAQRYEALFRIFESLSSCREPEELSRTLAARLHQVIAFDHLDMLVFRENSKDIEWHLWGEGRIAFPDIPVRRRQVGMFTTPRNRATSLIGTRIAGSRG